jgi:hypothetical protein
LIFAYLLLVILPIGAVWYIFWSYRRRQAQREAASEGRMHELIGTAQASPAETRQPAGEVAAPAAPAPSANPYVSRERLLTPPQTLLYYLLRSGLPDHVVFAQMSVGSVLDAAPTLAAYAQEEQARIFARHVVDFVVTDKSTRPVAVVKLVNTGENMLALLASMRAWFAATGVRFVEVDAAALPRKEAVRALVLGDADAHENGESDALVPG